MPPASRFTVGTSVGIIVPAQIAVALYLHGTHSITRSALNRATEGEERRKEMKVIVLGGAGDMGSKAVEDLAVHPDVDAVTIADYNESAANAVVQRLTDATAILRVQPVDANDHDALVEALRGHDVAASALGPFYHFEPLLVRAALEAGVDYISICDDWLGAQKILDEYDEPARRQGRIVISGMGASPGLSNIGVRMLAAQLDKPRKAVIAVYMPLESGEGLAVLKHVLFAYGSTAPTWRNGRLENIPAGSIAADVQFPKFGRIRAWNVGHTEPVTIPRFLPDFEEVTLLMGMGPGTRLFVWLGRLGLFSTPKRIDRVANFLSRILPSGEPGAPKPEGAIRIDVEGEKGGKPVHLMACGTAEMRPATGGPLAIGTVMLAKRQLLVSEGGVYAPEAAFDPEAVLRELSKQGIATYSDLEMSKPIVVS